jgi:type VI secretion system secreted protein Hcp
MRGTTTITVLTLAVCLVAIDGAAQGSEAFMTIAGIPGQITIRVDRTDWTQIQGMPDPRTPQRFEIDSITGSRAASPLISRGGSAGDRDRGSALIEDFALVKDIDKASPKLHDKVLSGEPIAEVRIEIVPSGPEQRTQFSITMTNVVVTRIVEQPTAGRDRPTEKVTFSCQSLEWETRAAGGYRQAATPYYPITPRPR